MAPDHPPETSKIRLELPVFTSAAVDLQPSEALVFRLAHSSHFLWILRTANCALAHLVTILTQIYVQKAIKKPLPLHPLISSSVKELPLWCAKRHRNLDRGPFRTTSCHLCLEVNAARPNFIDHKRSYQTRPRFCDLFCLL